MIPVTNRNKEATKYQIPKKNRNMYSKPPGIAPSLMTPAPLPRIAKRVKYELLGLFYIFLAILGSGAGVISDGAIMGGLEYMFRFFLGIWYFVASLFLLVTGIILLVKRRYPDFSHKKMIGFYIVFLGVLLLTHIQTFEHLLLLEGDTSILKATWDNFFDY